MVICATFSVFPLLTQPLRVDRKHSNERRCTQSHLIVDLIDINHLKSIPQRFLSTHRHHHHRELIAAKPTNDISPLRNHSIAVAIVVAIAAVVAVALDSLDCYS